MAAPEHRAESNDVYVVPAVVLWDFGDTLVDERWMRREPRSCPDWESAWVDVMTELADGWNVGDVATSEVYTALAARSGLSVAGVERHAVSCCRDLTFHTRAWSAAKERRWPQAIVTVNPDVFEHYIVPEYQLDEVFDMIVTSWSENTADKVQLCEIALACLGYDGDRHDVLLIDNRLDLVRAWVWSGGSGYWFRTDEQFGGDLGRLFP